MARDPSRLRPLSFQRGFLAHPEGSCLVSMGQTRVICTASVEEEVPRWLRGQGRGWITAEYSMLPRATDTRNTRAVKRGRLDGRSTEIQRLIGRSLRAAVDLEALGERLITLDCDVIQADGGTRTASINGAMVALLEALEGLRAGGAFEQLPLRHLVTAVSVGIVDGAPLLDLCYVEDSRAEVDMNFAMTADGQLIEVQGTAEGAPFSRAQLDQLTDLAAAGCLEAAQGIAAAFPGLSLPGLDQAR